MRQPRPFTDRERANLKAMCEAGELTVVEIARVLDRHPGTVQREIDLRGFKRPRSGREVLRLLKSQT